MYTYLNACVLVHVHAFLFLIFIIKTTIDSTIRTYKIPRVKHLNFYADTGVTARKNRHSSKWPLAALRDQCCRRIQFGLTAHCRCTVNRLNDCNRQNCSDAITEVMSGVQTLNRRDAVTRNAIILSVVQFGKCQSRFRCLGYPTSDVRKEIEIENGKSLMSTKHGTDHS